MEKHKHHDLIVSWAKGHKIQVLMSIGNHWIDIDEPTWQVEYEYRIKPEYVTEDVYIYYNWDSVSVCIPTEKYPANYRITHEKFSQDVVSIERIVKDER